MLSTEGWWKGELPYFYISYFMFSLFFGRSYVVGGMNEEKASYKNSKAMQEKNDDNAVEF